MRTLSISLGFQLNVLYTACIFMRILQLTWKLTTVTGYRGDNQIDKKNTRTSYNFNLSTLYQFNIIIFNCKYKTQVRWISMTFNLQGSCTLWKITFHDFSMTKFWYSTTYYNIRKCKKSDLPCSISPYSHRLYKNSTILLLFFPLKIQWILQAWKSEN